MKMKKIGALVLALVMALSLTVTAFADTIESVTTDNTKQTNVYGTFVPEGTGTIDTSTVYKVDLTWGDMKFRYKVTTTAETTYKWNPEVHDYTVNGTGTTTADGAWEVIDATNGGDKVTLKNHSNAPVKVDFSSTKTADANGIELSVVNANDSDAAFTNETRVLATAVGTTVEEAPTLVGRVKLSGALDASKTSQTQLFTLTVTLTAPDAD